MSGNKRIAKPPIIDTNIPTNEQWYTHQVSGTPRPIVSFRHRYAIDAIGLTQLAHSPAGHGHSTHQGIWGTVVTKDHSIGGQPQVRLAYRQNPGSASGHARGWKVNQEPLLALDPDPDGALRYLQTDMAAQRNGNYIYAQTNHSRTVSPSKGGRWSPWQPGYTKTYQALPRGFNGGLGDDGPFWVSHAFGQGIVDYEYFERYIHDYNTGQDNRSGIGDVPWGGVLPWQVPVDSNGRPTIDLYPPVSVAQLGQQALADARSRKVLVGNNEPYVFTVGRNASHLVGYRSGNIGPYYTDTHTWTYDYRSIVNVQLEQYSTEYRAVPFDDYQRSYDQSDPTDLSNFKPHPMDQLTLNADYFTPPNGGPLWEWEDSHSTLSWKDINCSHAPNYGTDAITDRPLFYSPNGYPFQSDTIDMTHNLYVGIDHALSTPTATYAYSPVYPWQDVSNMQFLRSFTYQMTVASSGATSVSGGAGSVHIPLSTLAGDARRISFVLQPDIAESGARDSEVMPELPELRAYKNLSNGYAFNAPYMDGQFMSYNFAYAAPAFSRSINVDSYVANDNSRPADLNLFTDRSAGYYASLVNFQLTFPRWRYWISYDVIPGHYSDWIDSPDQAVEDCAWTSYSETGLEGEIQTVGSSSNAHPVQSALSDASGYYLPAFPTNYNYPRAEWWFVGISAFNDGARAGRCDREILTYQPSGYGIPDQYYQPSNLPDMQGLQLGVDYAAIPRGNGYVEFEEPVRKLVDLEVVGNAVCETGLVYTNNATTSQVISGTNHPIHTTAWPSPSSDSTVTVKIVWRDSELQAVNTITDTFGLNVGTSASVSRLDIPPGGALPLDRSHLAPAGTGTEQYWTHSFATEGHYEASTLRLIVSMTKPTIGPFPDVPSASGNDINLSTWSVSAGIDHDSFQVKAHWKLPRYRYWIPRVTGPDALVTQEHATRVVRIGPNQAIEVRHETSARHPVSPTEYARSKHHTMFVSDDTTPFIWQTWGDVSEIFNNDFGNAWTGVAAAGWSDDGSGLGTFTYKSSQGQYLATGHLGAYIQSYQNRWDIYAFGPVLVHPWKAGDHGAPELWYFVMNGDGVHATYDIYAAKWAAANYRRMYNVSLTDDQPFNDYIRRYPAGNPEGYAFDHNWYRPANHRGRIGPFPDVKVWNRKNGTREADSIVFPAFQVLRDPKRLGQMHVTIVNSGPLGDEY